MKNNIFVQLHRATAAAIALLLFAGCASNGYISSNITTGIGLDVSENSQTQIPHVRFGYIRNGLYYIPTGKTNDPTGHVYETPHVVSKIHVSSEFLKNISIIEKFAVGDKASNSPAAANLFADTSTETGSATQVRGARGTQTSELPPQTRETKITDQQLAALINGANTAAAARKNLDALIAPTLKVVKNVNGEIFKKDPTKKIDYGKIMDESGDDKANIAEFPRDRAGFADWLKSNATNDKVLKAVQTSANNQIPKP